MVFFELDKIPNPLLWPLDPLDVYSNNICRRLQDLTAFLSANAHIYNTPPSKEA